MLFYVHTSDITALLEVLQEHNYMKETLTYTRSIINIQTHMHLELTELLKITLQIQKKKIIALTS